jgi:hypothetical protein
MVIAVFARAKLLGMKILTIDARVAIAPDKARDLASAAARATTVLPDASLTERQAGQHADLSRAVRLLEEGTKSLDKSRRNRSLESSTDQVG